jgi:phosphinothricin acetyltransferase
MEVREAAESDLPEILAIYNDVIATSTAVYRETPADIDERREWLRARIAQGYPVIVAVDETGVTGFGSFGDFRNWPGYRFTVEHSVHVRADRRAHGIGAAIVAELVRRAKALGKHVLIAGIDADNIASLRLHERLGFEKVAHFREVGWKFGRWLDLVFMQRRL